jgi:hypothetical protein
MNLIAFRDLMDRLPLTQRLQRYFAFEICGVPRQRHPTIYVSFSLLALLYLVAATCLTLPNWLKLT